MLLTQTPHHSVEIELQLASRVAVGKARNILMADLLTWTNGKLKTILGGQGDYHDISEYLLGIEVLSTSVLCYIQTMIIFIWVQDEKELADFVGGMLPQAKDSALFLRELSAKKKECSSGGAEGREPASGSGYGDRGLNEGRDPSTAASSFDSGRRRNVDDYRDLLHLSGRLQPTPHRTQH